MNLDPQLIARLVSASSAASGTVATLLQQIMAAAMKSGLKALPTVIHEVATAMEAQYPNEAGLIAALEGILAQLVPTPAV